MHQLFAPLFRPQDDYSDEVIVEQTALLFFDAPGSDGVAARRALRLLYRVLDPAQRWEFTRRGHFTVEVPGWGRFQVLPRSIFNVLSLETGVAYCVSTLMPLPVPDLMLVHKLLLENDPDRFFSIANRRHPDGGRICWPGS